ncbi:MAG TPA: hypothetical protein VL334_17645 [Anaerolineae bacterium]|nr:hypothetical protein [Anaerolineae bacterium]
MSEQHKLAAARRGAARTAQMEQQVTEAMRAIHADLQANDGIYPHNGGAVSMAELARRAGISESSFYKKEPENVALKERAALWLDTLKKKETVGRMRVKKTLSQRAEDWHQKHAALEQRHICTELELQASKAEWEKEHKELTEKIATLERENATLIELLKSGGDRKVTPLRVKEK